MRLRFALVAGVLLASAFLPGHSLLAQSTGDDRRDIVGVWRGSMPGDPPDSLEIIITPIRIISRDLRTGRWLGGAVYAIDPALHAINARRVDRFGQLRVYLGLYFLEGDTLRWCTNRRSMRRPATLEHRPDKDQYLMELQRQK